MSLMHRLTCGFEELSLSLMGFEGNVKKIYFLWELLLLCWDFWVWCNISRYIWYNVTIEHITERVVVVPRWFLVWYNPAHIVIAHTPVVVPRWFLVWYNRVIRWKAIVIVVVPRWFLVWYNCRYYYEVAVKVVVPRWFLVWYNVTGQGD